MQIRIYTFISEKIQYYKITAPLPCIIALSNINHLPSLALWNSIKAFPYTYIYIYIWLN